MTTSEKFVANREEIFGNELDEMRPMASKDEVRQHHTAVDEQFREQFFGKYHLGKAVLYVTAQRVAGPIFYLVCTHCLSP